MHVRAMAALFLAGTAATQDDAARPGPVPELGAVAWGRGLDAALQASKKDGRPLFVLFQEVPG